MSTPQNQKNNSLPNDCIDLIIRNIGEADQKLIATQTEDLIRKNGDRTNDYNGFLFGGTYYTMLSVKDARKLKKQVLSPDLYDDGTILKKTISEFYNDTQRLKQGLNVLLRDCKDLQDIRDALPNACRIVLPQIYSLQRTREVAWTLKDKPLLLDQYPQTEHLLTYYLSSRMLY